MDLDHYRAVEVNWYALPVTGKRLRKQKNWKSRKKKSDNRPAPAGQTRKSKMSIRERLYDQCLEDINEIMWNSHCLKGREFGRKQGEQIMAVLERWAGIEDNGSSDTTAFLPRAEVAAALDALRAEMASMVVNLPSDYWIKKLDGTVEELGLKEKE